MRIPWPWTRSSCGERTVIASSPDRFVYACSDARGQLIRCGVEDRGDDAPAEFQRRVRTLGLASKNMWAVLPLADAQLLQIEAPAVKPEELKAAARWRIKDQVEGRLDDLTLDVMVVGADVPRPNRQMFVVAARNDTILATVARAQAAGLELSVIDIAETAQRNLQTRLSDAAGLRERATAALVRHGAHALLTICAGGELYYARRIDWELPFQPAPTQPEAEEASLSFAAARALEEVDFIDYGAEATDDPAQLQTEVPRLVIELQRSCDLWERSWPDLPLAAMWLQVGPESPELAALLARTLGVRVHLLDPAEVLPGYEHAAATPHARAALLPVVGALLREETRRL
jgi:MSHA biogenesis protein MshI